MDYKIINGFTDYQINDAGEVYSLKRNKKLKPYEKKGIQEYGFMQMGKESSG